MEKNIIENFIVNQVEKSPETKQVIYKVNALLRQSFKDNSRIDH